MKNYIRYVAPEKFVRTLNRQKYKELQHFLRLSARKVFEKMEKMDLPKRFTEFLTTGKSRLDVK